MKVQWKQWRGAVDLRSSLFCEVRDPVDHPLCEFYAAALRRLMHLFELDADVITDRCRATGAGQCSMSLVVRPGTRAAGDMRHDDEPVTSRRLHAAAFVMALVSELECRVLPAAHAQVSTPARPAVVVVPFNSDGRDARGYWLREASAVILTDDLMSLGIAPMSSDERLRAFDSLRVPATATSQPCHRDSGRPNRRRDTSDRRLVCDRW